MFVAGDRVFEEDKRFQEFPSNATDSSESLERDENSPPPPVWKWKEVQLPSGETMQLLPSAHDAYAIFEDLCLLANSEKAKFLRLEALPKTFALELVESVLTNCHAVIRKVSSLSYYLP